MSPDDKHVVLTAREFHAHYIAWLGAFRVALGPEMRLHVVG